MLKISQLETASHSLTLKLEGRLVGPWVTELNRVCESLFSEHRTVKLDLTDVSFVDVNGVSALASLGSRGVTMANCSPFVEEQLKRPIAR